MSYPLAWGRVYWFVLHHASTKNVSSPHFQLFLDSFTRRLPCPACSVHAKEFIKKMPLTGSRDRFEYIIHFHNHVNSKLQKPILSVDLARRHYNQTLTQLDTQSSVDCIIFSTMLYSVYSSYFASEDDFVDFLRHYFQIFYPDCLGVLDNLKDERKLNTIVQKKTSLNFLFTEIVGDTVDLDACVRDLFVPKSKWSIMSETMKEKAKLQKDIYTLEAQIKTESNSNSRSDILIIVFSVILIGIHIRLIQLISRKK